MADSIPNEVLFEHIFVRLHVKSLIRCKSVCKNWNKLINDPDFARKHLRFHQRQRVLLQLHEDDYVSVDIGTGDTHKINKVSRYMNIIGSSNGLLCGLVGPDRKKLIIWNPSTGDLKLVRTGPSLRNIQRNDFYRVGFCYDSVENDFKIVYLNSQRSGRLKKVKFDIYSLKSDSWKIIREFDGLSNLEGITPATRGYDVNGTIYWLVQRRYMYDILLFNVRQNNFRKLQLPQGCKPWPTVMTRLLVLGSSLGLCHYSSQDNGVLLWKLEGHQNKEWSNLMYITQPSRLFKDVSNLKSLCLAQSNEVVLLNSQKFVSEKGFKLYDEDSKSKFMFYREMSKINFFRYDEVRNRIKKLNIRGICHVHYIMQTEVYVESLISPNTITRNDDVPIKKKRKRRNDDDTNKKARTTK